MSEVRPTMKTIAGEAGVSVMTVSLALRNHPRISPTTQERIRSIATKLGYRTNPMVASLMTHIRSSRPVPYEANIAFFTSTPGPQGWKSHQVTRIAYEGVCRRAADLGFLIDLFWIEEPGMRQGRLERVLRSRNIQGVILAPLPQAGDLDDLNWANWSAAALGNSLLSPRLHRITNHQFHGMSLILETLEKKGYRRIGLAIDPLVDDKVDRAWTSCATGYHLRIPPKQRVPVYLGDLASPRLEAWLEKYNPDVLVGHDGLLYNLDALGIRVPQDYSFAHLALPSEFRAGLSGLDQNWESVGAAAVDSVVAQIYRNERGIPESPKTVMLEGVWVDGATAPGK